MGIDMEQFRQTFIEESLEGLQVMESELLNLDPGSADTDTINTIFRAAHSIKGGAGTFGFQAISDFTHGVETLLDQMRAGERQVTRKAVDLLLESVDCLRELIAAAAAGSEPDTARSAEVGRRLEAMLGGDGEQPGAETPATGNGTQTAGWRIRFRPFTHMLQTGNDPVRMFRALQELGTLEVRADTGQVPALADLDPEECHLAWDLTLRGNVPRAAVDEVFEWVEGDCELDIQPLAALAPPPRERRSGEDRRSQPDRRKSAAVTEANSIRVGIDKIDALINMVGELVITQSMLSQLGEDFDISRLDRLQDGLAELERNTRELQESVMRIRMLPISFVFNRFPRLVHDLSSRFGKAVALEVSGEQTELDKTVMEKIGDPLVHLVRNALDHGIETPEARAAAGKPETGTLSLNAYHQGGNIVIEIADDGAGLNRERILAKARERGLVGEDEALDDDQVHELIFQPGFSTADVVSEISGRGVGMDVVKRNITALGGTIEVRSEAGRGSTFTIRLPLTLAILDGQLVQVGGQTFVIPLVSIIESLLIDTGRTNAVAGRARVYKLREDYIPILCLHELFNLRPGTSDAGSGLLVVVEGDGHRIGLVVDDLLAQQQVVIKSLETNFRKVDGLSGATILGDGTVALILDVAGLVRLARATGGQRPRVVGGN